MRGAFPRRVLPLIRTFTVGPGFPPDRPHLVRGGVRGLSPPARNFTAPGARASWYGVYNARPPEVFPRVIQGQTLRVPSPRARRNARPHRLPPRRRRALRRPPTRPLALVPAFPAALVD